MKKLLLACGLFTLLSHSMVYAIAPYPIDSNKPALHEKKYMLETKQLVDSLSTSQRTKLCNAYDSWKQAHQEAHNATQKMAKKLADGGYDKEYGEFMFTSQLDVHYRAYFIKNSKDFYLWGHINKQDNAEPKEFKMINDRMAILLEEYIPRYKVCS